MLICLTMRSEDTRGEALERRHRLLRDERFHEIPLARLTEPSSRSGSPASSAAKRAASCWRTSSATPRAIRCSRRSSCACCSTTAPCGYEHGVGACAPSATRELPGGAHRADGAPPRASVAERAHDSQHRGGDRPRVRHRPRDGGRRRHRRRSARRARRGHRARRDRAVADRRAAQFSFTHGLLVDAVRRAINPRRLARIHERVADAMEERTPDNVAEIAMHYDRAGIAAARRSARDGRRQRGARHVRARRSATLLRDRRACREHVRRTRARAASARRGRGDGGPLRADRRAVRSRARRHSPDGADDHAMLGAAAHARAHARAAGPAARRDDRGLPRAAREGARSSAIARRRRRCST